MKRAAVVVHPGKHDDLDGFRAVAGKAMADLGWAESCRAGSEYPG